MTSALTFGCNNTCRFLFCVTFTAHARLCILNVPLGGHYRVGVDGLLFAEGEHAGQRRRRQVRQSPPLKRESNPCAFVYHNTYHIPRFARRGAVSVYGILALWVMSRRAVIITQVDRLYAAIWLLKPYLAAIDVTLNIEPRIEPLSYRYWTNVAPLLNRYWPTIGPPLYLIEPPLDRHCTPLLDLRRTQIPR